MAVCDTGYRLSGVGVVISLCWHENSGTRRDLGSCRTDSRRACHCGIDGDERSVEKYFAPGPLFPLDSFAGRAIVVVDEDEGNEKKETKTMGKKHNPFDPSAPVADGPATATAEAPPPAEPVTPTNGGAPLAPMPVIKRLRDPNAVRPFFLVCARNRDTGAIRVLFEEMTIGRARKVAPRLANLIERDEIGPVIVRCKLAV